MLALNLRLQSINFDPNIISDIETIRVIVTTFPDNQKHSVSLEAKNMFDSEILFKIKLSESTNNIIISFKKKGFFSEGETFASTCIFIKSINQNYGGYMKIDLFEHNFNTTQKNNYQTHKKRKIVGSMDANFSFNESFNVSNYEFGFYTNERNLLLRKLNRKLNSRRNDSQYIYN